MLIALILVLVIWELYWTSKACWKAAKSDEWNWFIFMMAISLFGLPEMYYLYFRKVDVSL
ncbi:MAG: DUF5652 family protein [Porticoccaceae bacterium]